MSTGPGSRLPDRTQAVAAVILAAGRSRRMPGRTKLLRDFRGKPVVRTVAEVAVEAGLRPVAVSVVSDGGPVAGAFYGLPIHCVPVRGPARGRIASVAAGLSAVWDHDVSAAMILLGDEPELDRRDVETVRKAWAAGMGDLLRARYRDRPGHPVLLARSLFPLVVELASAQGEGQAGVWARLTGAGVVGHEVDLRRDAPIDVDSPSALRAARSRTDRT